MTLPIRPTPALRLACAIGAAAMAVQVIFLAEPGFAVTIVNTIWDKLVHFLYFGAMALLLWIAADKRRALAVWATVLFIGAVDETHQAYVPGRSSDIADWLADGLGAAAVLIVMQRVSTNGGRPCAES